MIGGAGGRPAMPSSVHAEGRAARRLVEEARDAGGGLVGAAPECDLHLAAATEANMLALTPASRLAARSAARPAVCLGDRASLGASGRPLSAEAIEQLPVDARRASSISPRCSGCSTQGASGRSSRVMLANNETGVVQPVARGCRDRPRGGRLAACRCRAGAGPHPLRYRCARRRPADPLGAQARRPARAPARWSGARRHPYRRCH